jgi:hypothetical protein
MQITPLPPIPVTVPGGLVVHIAAQRWALEPWSGEPDPPDLGKSWARKGKFAVGGRRSCAELAVVDYLRRDGWGGVWVNAYRNELRTEWFPAPAARALADIGAPGWAAAAFDRLRTANGNRLAGFFDVFAWREPGEFWFGEVKVGKDKLGTNQRDFIGLALRFHQPEQFTIIEVPA